MLQKSSIFTKRNTSKPENLPTGDKVLAVVQASKKLTQWISGGETHNKVEYQIYSYQSKECFSEEVMNKVNSDVVYSYTYDIDKETNKLINRQLFINLDKIIISQQKEEYREIFEGHCIPYTLSNLLIAIIVGEIATEKQIRMFHKKDELEHLAQVETVIKNPLGKHPSETKYYWLFSAIGTYKRFVITTQLRMCMKKLKQEYPAVLNILD